VSKYITKSDIIDRYGEDLFVQVADLNCDGTADIDAVIQAIEDAEACVDSYIGNRYALPLPGIISATTPALNTVPAALIRPTVDIAIYFLTSEHPTLTEERTKRYDQAKVWLKMVGNSELSLGVDEPPPSRNGGVVRYGPARVFTRDKTGGLL
jgi:phage gp36-like protein